MCSIVSYHLKNITCVCSSEKTTSYRRTSSSSQGKSSAPSPGCAGSQEELYCSPVGGAPSPAPPPANANNSATVPIILPPPRSRKNAMVTCHTMIFYFEICFFKCLLDDYIVCLLKLFAVFCSFICEHEFKGWNTLHNFCPDFSPICSLEKLILVVKSHSQSADFAVRFDWFHRRYMHSVWWAQT